MGTKYDHKGRVEIFHNGVWGTVCNNHWLVFESDVVCRQLGYFGGLPYYVNTEPGTGRIWLDDVHCGQSDLRLTDCAHADWGVNNCDHSDDAGVYCFPDL